MNRLAHETSPYLRQHADNPVEWYPWGDEAFAEARREDKPILLSVGYSSCHWCHVMAHESFEDAEVAAVMNRDFVNVKVDREERPDVDDIYMQAVQAMTGRGGWPMTVFLVPDGRPFYGGTYFPKDDRPGMPGFFRVMAAISDAWRDRRDDLLDQAGKLHAIIEESAQLRVTGTDEPTPAILEQAYEAVRAQFDPRFGGFGGAPKFPQAMTLDFLLRAHVRGTGASLGSEALDPSALGPTALDPTALDMVTTSLDAMAAGGMYDQLGGGFHRYSVDAYWLVPHFEKMLYDQALLVPTFLHGYLVTRQARYRRVVEETIECVLRDLRHADGGFFSAEDADSEGIEGKFYLWSLAEIEDICGNDADDVVRYFGVTAAGNFEEPHTGYRGNILHVVDASEERPASVQRAMAKLFATRAQRVRPGLDDKVLLGWNALFLRALAEAARALGRDDWMQHARDNARFLLANLRRDDGRWLRSWQDGHAVLPAYAEDYAALAEALLTLAEVDDPAWLDEARTVVDELIELFHDDDRGGFFTTGIDAEPLIVRPKDLQDNATPSACSLATHALLRLAALTGEARYSELAERWLRALAPLLGEHPTSFAYLLGALERQLTAPLEIAIVGATNTADTEALRTEVARRFLPNSVVLTAAPGADERSPLLAGRELIEGRATAYVCEHYACRQPVTTVEKLRAQLDEVLRKRRVAPTKRNC